MRNFLTNPFESLLATPKPQKNTEMLDLGLGLGKVEVKADSIDHQVFSDEK